MKVKKININIFLFLAVLGVLALLIKFRDISSVSEHDPMESVSEVSSQEEVLSFESSIVEEDTSTELSVEFDEGVLDSRTALPAGISLECPNVEVEFTNPLDSGRVSSLFGFRINPVTSIYKFHKGYDIAAPYKTEIKSIQDGTVTYIGYDKNGYGNYLKVTHDGGIVSLYAHCSKLLVQKGDVVKAGETIALVGSTGGSTGNHLHIEININGTRYDPEWFFGGIYD